jgi:hypothetical protein
VTLARRLRGTVHGVVLAGVVGAVALTGPVADPVEGSPREPCASAVVRTPAGELREVAFETGWAVYTGRQAGTLVTGCLADHP